MSTTEIPHVGTFAGRIGSQATQQILCGGKGDAPGCARCWAGTYRLSFGWLLFATFLHLEAKVTKWRKAATSDRGALEAASTLLRRPPDGQLNADECCHTLIDNLCEAITTSRRHSKEAQVITNIVRRFLGGLHLRQLVILLGRILPLLRSQATPGTTVIQASGRAAARAGPARIMHTMATISPAENEVICFAKSAELCGLRQFHLNFSPAVTSLAHFHPTRQPGPGSRPEGNTKFPVGTLLLLEVSFPAEHVRDAQRPMRNTLQGPACIRAQRGHHGFTLATVPVVLPMGPWPLAESFQSTGPIIQSLSADSPGSHSLLNQGSGPIWLTHETCWLHSLGSSHLLFTRHCATNHARRT